MSDKETTKEIRERIEDALGLSKEESEKISDEGILKATEGSFLRASIELKLALRDLKKAFIDEFIKTFGFFRK